LDEIHEFWVKNVQLGLLDLFNGVHSLHDFFWKYDKKSTEFVKNVDQFVIKWLGFKLVLLLLLDFFLFCVKGWTGLFAGVSMNGLFFLFADEASNRVRKSGSHFLDLVFVLSHGFNLLSTFNLYGTDW
jgi:hypothetical protein